MSRVTETQHAAALAIKDRAQHLGFDLVGIAATNDPSLQEEMVRYKTWLSKGYAATMGYLSRHESIKADPSLFLAQAKSIVSVAMIYGSEAKADSSQAAKVSIYTRGSDYHQVLGQKLKVLCDSLEAEFPGEKCRSYVDANPVLDRFWAWRAGLGWLGKNTCLINRKVGSFVFLGGFMTTLKLPPDGPSADHCGRCRLCIDACPTGALREPRVLDSNLCIAYHTIENRGVVPNDVAAQTGQWIAGCDVCQTVCPWNDPITQGVGELQSGNGMFGRELSELLNFDEMEFKSALKGVAMGRMKYGAFLRNLAIAISNSEYSNENKSKAYEKLRSRLAHLNLEEPASEGLRQSLEWAESRLSF